MKLTAEEILKIVSDNYSELDFAYGEWLETEVEVPDEIGVKEEEAKKSFYKLNLKDKELSSEDSLFVEYKNMPSEYTMKEKYVLDYLGLGEVVDIKRRGGEGQGELWYQVWYFKNHDVYIRIDGHYTSYNGVDFYDGYGSETFPKEQTRIIYE